MPHERVGTTVLLGCLAFGLAACSKEPTAPTAVAAIATLTVTPAANTLALNATAQLTATAKDAAGNVLTGRAIAWASSDPAIATVSNSGLVTGAGAGAATITATSEGVTGSATISVTGAADFFDDFSSGAASHWTPESGSWSVVNGLYRGEGTTAELCSGFGPNQSVIRDVLARDVEVELDMTSVARVDKAIILRSGGDRDQIELNFRADPYDDLVVQEISKCVQTFPVPPFTLYIPHVMGQAIHVRLQLYDNRLSVWMNGRVVLDYGFQLAGRTGRVGVGVLNGGVTTFDNVRVHVLTSQPPTPVAYVTVSPQARTITASETLQLTATTWDWQGNVLTGRAVTWSSNAPAVATVSPSGQVTGVAEGTAAITATSEGVSSDATITVSAVAVASVDVTPASASMLKDATLQLTATPRDASGNVLSGRAVTWASSDAAVATVSGTGVVTGVRPGQATITATSGGHSGTAAITVDVITFTSVRAGNDFSCGLTTGGAAYCWGWSYALGTTAPSSPGCLFPCSSVPVPVNGGLHFAEVDAGEDPCGVTPDHAAYCWGQGWLGNGSFTPFDVYAVPVPPTAVSGGLAFTSVHSGGEHICGIVALTGAAYCWGLNANGQLGATTTEHCSEDVNFPAAPCSTVPVPVTGDLVLVSVVTGGSHTCGLTAGGAAYCWGDNSAGELGIGTTRGPELCSFTTGSGNTVSVPCSTAPVAVAGRLTFVELTAGGAGGSHTCGLTADGAAYCWGDNSVGQLGNGSYGGMDSVPVAVVGGLLFTSLSAGVEQTCGLTSSGTVYCWGAYTGPLNPNPSGVPVPAPGGLHFTSIAVGRNHDCGMGVDGVAYCWGRGDLGEIGNGRTDGSAVPAKVVGQP